MKKIEIELTEQQEKYLRMFAEKQCDGADDNRFTCNAIHVVETNRPYYIPYHLDQELYFGDLPLIFTTDSEYENWSDSEVEAIQEWYECREEEPPFEIIPFNAMEFKRIKVKNEDGSEEEVFIKDYDDYFGIYGVKWHVAAWLQDKYEPVAFFFILDEAKRYIEYQRHNLRKPRTYTYSSGYANYGDFDHFRDLLLIMGEKLNKEVENTEQSKSV